MFKARVLYLVKVFDSKGEMLAEEKLILSK